VGRGLLIRRRIRRSGRQGREPGRQRCGVKKVRTSPIDMESKPLSMPSLQQKSISKAGVRWKRSGNGKQLVYFLCEHSCGCRIKGWANTSWHVRPVVTAHKLALDPLPSSYFFVVSSSSDSSWLGIVAATLLVFRVGGSTSDSSPVPRRRRPRP
jgi:hypothetical protein